ncbi:TonB-dependent receptor [Fulvitalea axinellae]|uniref:TonB-dependent receptor n=1 Tax=Fulvitalea axinellae TaxID=1182444 RepID=A0AAU9CPK8_9BACT|nr:TonB-dependent receptor [Fulvitalea axinellae]
MNAKLQNYRSLRFFMTAFFLLAFFTANAQKGMVRGRVLDSESNQGLPGVTVLAKAAGVGAVTDINGEFKLFNVASGSEILIFSYMGYETTEHPVEVLAGGVAELKVALKPGVLVGDEVVVTADRIQGQAAALNRQRNNVNVTNLVAADQVGKFPDANIGDAMKRIPGITMQYDQGEARFGVVRGTSPAWNSVTVNGERVPSAEGEIRSVQLDLIPADMVKAIEVSKTVTPDMDADAIGGAVNLVTKSAPEGFRISATGATGYNTLREKPIWTGGLVLGNRFFKNKLGMVLSASYNYHSLGSDNVEFEWDEDDGKTFISEMDVRTYELARERISLSGALDFKINQNNTLFFNAMYNQRKDWENRYKLRYTDLQMPDESGVSRPDAEDGGNVIEIETKAGSHDNKKTRLEDQRTRFFSLGGEHLLGSKVQMNWTVNWAKASEDRPDERYVKYVYEEADFNVDLSDRDEPNMTPNNIPVSDFELDELYQEQQETYEKDFGTRLDFKVPLGVNSFLKFGGKFKDKRKVRDNIYEEYDGDDYESMGDRPLVDKTKSDFLAGDYVAGNFVSRDFLADLDFDAMRKNGKLELKKDEYIPGNFEADERIVAGYAMATHRVGRFDFLGGLRIEQTNLDYTAYDYREESDDADESVTPKSAKNDFTNVMPALHVKYSMPDNSILRFAWTNTLARPQYIEFAPYAEYNDDRDKIKIGNPDLGITKSMNLDLMYERYFGGLGLVSGGAFYKRIDDFVYSLKQKDVMFNGSEVDLTKPLNGDYANLYGFELAFQHNFDYLPGVLGGLGLYANYTYTKSEAFGFVVRDEEDGLSLPQTAENTWNLSVSYERKRLSMRLSINYTSDYLDELSEKEFEDAYYDKQFFMDFNASYSFTKNWRWFIEANNLTNQPLRYYQSSSDQVRQMEYYGPRFNMGVKFDLFK